MSDGAPRRSLVRRLAAGLGHGAAGALWLALLAWILGRVLTDRTDWSQWLWWMPSWTALILAAGGVLLALRPGRWRRRPSSTVSCAAPIPSRPA
jgi:hypothetical protein